MRSTDEQALARALRDRADRVDPAPGPRPDDVIGLAVGIRRRRRLTALAAVAAAAVIAIPTALGATGVLGRDAAPQPITEAPESAISRLSDSLGLDAVTPSADLPAVPPMATGVAVHKRDGTPAAGAVVALYAWDTPELTEKHPNGNLQTLAGWSVADEDGRFQVRVDPGVDLSDSIDDGGFTDFDLMAYDELGSFVPWAFSAVPLADGMDPESETESAILDPETREVIKPFDGRLEIPEPRYPLTDAVLDVADLPTGAPPKIAYARGRSGSWTLHTPDGELPLPGTVMAVSPSGADWVVTTEDEDVVRTTILDAPTFPSGDTWVVNGEHVTSADGGTVVWVTTDNVVMARSASGDTVELGTIDRRGDYTPSIVVGEDCAVGRCAVYLNRADKAKQILLLTGLSGLETQITNPPLRRVTTSDDDMIGGYVEIDEEFSTTRSELRQGESTLFETTVWTLERFSPGGAHLIGTPAYSDGYGAMTLGLLDPATGEAVASWGLGEVSATYQDRVWEDDEHVLIVVFQEGEWSVARAGIDGSLEYAIAPFPGEDTDFPLLLAQ